MSAPLILVAETAGFCFGVKRAVRMAYEAASKYKNVFTLGPLIHNPQVVESLRREGIGVVEEHTDLPPKATVIVRSHGITLDVYNWLVEAGYRIVDATCPFVKKAQKIVADLSEDGFGVVIVGDKDHPEVKALVSYGKGRATIYPNIPDADRVGVVAQTTQLKERFLECVCHVLNRGDFSELRVHNTVCQSTAERQKECKRLAERCEVVVVVGGRNSANTRKLVEIAKREGKDTYHIEVAKEIDPSWFFNKRVIGITAGASTPDWIIGEVVEAVSRITGGIVYGGEKGE